MCISESTRPFLGDRVVWLTWRMCAATSPTTRSLALYLERDESWYGMPAVRLPFEPEMWLVPLHGHTRGHCGVAIRTDAGWHFHVADAGPVGLEDYAPAWLVTLVLGPHTPFLRAFAAAHPEIRITTGHMWSDFFDRPVSH